MTTMKPDHDRGGAGGNAGAANKATTEKTIEQDAREIKHEAGDKARDTAEAGQHRLADEAGSLSDAIDAAASSLDDNDREGLARYARELSSHLSGAAKQLEGRSVDELANDAKRLARENPAMFMLGSIAVGFGLSRFFKASAETDSGTAHQSHDAGRNNDLAAGTAGQRAQAGMTEAHTASTAPGGGNGRTTI